MFLSLLTNKWRRKLLHLWSWTEKVCSVLFFWMLHCNKIFLKCYSFQNQLFVNIFFLYPSTDAGLWSRLSKCCRFYRLFLYGLCVSVEECQNAKKKKYLTIQQSNEKCQLHCQLSTIFHCLSLTLYLIFTWAFLIFI